MGTSDWGYLQVVSNHDELRRNKQGLQNQRLRNLGGLVNEHKIKVVMGGFHPGNGQQGCAEYVDVFYSKFFFDERVLISHVKAIFSLNDIYQPQYIFLLFFIQDLLEFA